MTNRSSRFLEGNSKFGGKTLTKKSWREREKSFWPFKTAASTSNTGDSLLKERQNGADLNSYSSDSWTRRQCSANKVPATIAIVTTTGS